MKTIGWGRRLSVSGDGRGLVGHGGAVLLRMCADRTGLTSVRGPAFSGRQPKKTERFSCRVTVLRCAWCNPAVRLLRTAGQFSRTNDIGATESAFRRRHEFGRGGPDDPAITVDLLIYESERLMTTARKASVAAPLLNPEMAGDATPERHRSGATTSIRKDQARLVCTKRPSPRYGHSSAVGKSWTCLLA